MPSTVVDQAGRHDYAFDALGQLTTAAHPAGQQAETFAYDAVGNRAANGAQFDGVGRLARDSRFTYSYDGEGRQVTRTELATGKTTRFEWNQLSQLRAVVDAGGARTSYRYDAFGRRIGVDGPSGTRRTAFGLEDQPLAELNSQGQVLNVTVSAPGLDTLLAFHVGSSVVYPIQDGDHNVTAVTDATGRVVERNRYSTFGESVGARPTATPYGFAGREWDSAAGAYYLRARYYDPSTGRFFSEDPRPAGNAYIYAGNNPLTSWDPTGQSTMSEQEADMVLVADATHFSNGWVINGFVYNTARLFQGVTQISGRVYAGITNAVARRQAEHLARGKLAPGGVLDDLELVVTGRVQLLSIEQALMNGIRANGMQMSNVARALSARNWELFGQELVERWIARNPKAPVDLIRLLQDGIKAAL